MHNTYIMYTYNRISGVQLHNNYLANTQLVGLVKENHSRTKDYCCAKLQKLIYGVASWLLS